MKKDIQQERQWVVKRLFTGEHIDSTFYLISQPVYRTQRIKF